MLVCLDESAGNEHTAQRKRGWSTFGIKPTVQRPLKRSERYSILPAYCSDGILTYLVYYGLIKEYTFEWFLEQMVLPLCNPFPGPRSIILLDNCSTHRNPRIRDLCDRFGVKLLYLPPYSPDFNPIEEFFSVLKAWMKRHFQDLDHMLFREFLDVGIRACNNQKTAEGYFAHSGYLRRFRGEVVDDND